MGEQVPVVGTRERTVHVEGAVGRTALWGFARHTLGLVNQQATNPQPLCQSAVSTLAIELSTSLSHHPIATDKRVAAIPSPGVCLR